MNKTVSRTQAVGRWLAVTALFILACGLLGADEPVGNDLLSQERWEAKGMGISLCPPLGSQLLQQTADNALVRILSPSGYNVVVSLSYSKENLKLDQVQMAALEQMASVQPSARVLEQKPMTLGGQDGALVTFKALDTKPGPVVISQAFTLLSPQRLLVIELNVDAKNYDAAKPAWDQMLASLRLEDPQAVAHQRSAMIQAGLAWGKAIDAKRLHAALIPQQWFRIVDHNKDIGYMLVRQAALLQSDKDNKLFKDCTHTVIQARIVIGEDAVDSLSEFFVSDDDKTELWSIGTTPRPVHPKANTKVDPTELPPETTWMETGMRDGDHIAINSNGPTGKKSFEWRQLPPGYISQVEQQLLVRLIPPTTEGTLGFFAYYPNINKVTFRTERIERNKDGSYRLLSRATPGQDEQVTQFDAAGNLKSITLPGGQTMVPSSIQQITAIWKSTDPSLK